MARLAGAILTVGAVFPAGTAFASAQQDVMAVVNQFADGLVKRDVKLVSATCAGETSITDNIKPYHWSGANACARWYSDYDTNNKSYQFVLDGILLNKPPHIVILGDQAYAVVSSDLEFTVRGQPMMDSGSLLTFALSRTDSGWRINEWTWTDGVLMADKDASVIRRAFTELALMLFTPASASAADRADVMAVVNQFADALVKADMNSVAATCTDETSIIDNIPPYQWNEASACARWYSDYDASNKANEFVLQRIQLDKPLHVDVSGERAYVVVSTKLEFTMKGQTATDSGSLLTFALVKAGSGWRISAWTWTDGFVMADKAAARS
jgi:ketosteroid isomerase-like protein